MTKKEKAVKNIGKVFGLIKTADVIMAKMIYYILYVVFVVIRKIVSLTLTSIVVYGTIFSVLVTDISINKTSNQYGNRNKITISVSFCGELVDTATVPMHKASKIPNGNKTLGEFVYFVRNDNVHIGELCNAFYINCSYIE